MLDPWYNKGIGGKRENYIEWLVAVITEVGDLSQHVFVWGFPEIIYKVLDYLPKGLELVAWLTWYYKNCPSVIRGWRSAQLTCLHLSRRAAKLYPEHFLNDAQIEKQRQGKLRYMPGPPSVIEVPLLIGWVGKKEQVGNPSKTAQKPIKVIEPLIRMTTKENDTVLDPMCGTGTTGAVCKMLGRKVILCDHDEQKVQMTERRLDSRRLAF
jgi:site-specific DNA-methyltransferase (adenine-specific)